MKVGACVLTSVSIIIFGVYDCIKFKKKTLIIEEILSLLMLLKNEINYKKASFSELLRICENENFNYISFSEGNFCLKCDTESRLSSDFYSFTAKIGTTDAQGQIALCREYEDKLMFLLNKQRFKEEKKLQINLSLSFLGALSVIIIFI